MQDMKSKHREKSFGIMLCDVRLKSLGQTEPMQPISLQFLVINLREWCRNTSRQLTLPCFPNNNLSNSGGRHKIKWGKISKNDIESCYTIPIDFEQSTLSMSDYNSLLDSPELIITFLMKHSVPFVKITKPRSKTGHKNCIKLPAYVKVARAEGISAFNSWKQSGFPTDDTHVTYFAKSREYHQKLRKFLNQSETDRIKDLCDAANSNENLFWKLIKGQRSSSKMSAFLVGSKLITDKNSIRNMWADHFEFLGKPSSNANFDSNFLAQVADKVQELFVSFTDDPSGTLSESLKYEEVEDVCSKLKMGISEVDVDYEHIRFAGPPLWKFFSSFTRIFSLTPQSLNLY